MGQPEQIEVVIRSDFMERQTRAEPVQALAELIWNSVDADATSVTVDFAFDDLAGGLSKIVVSDNGHGLPRAEAGAMFGSLGGSWKRFAGRTKTKRRMIHGQEGKGRYKAFALGRNAEWKICYRDTDRPKAYSISLFESNLTRVKITDEIDAPGRPSGAIVEINDIRRNFQTLTSKACLQELAEIFALYLINYGDVTISVAGNHIDPTDAIVRREPYPLTSITDDDGKEHEVFLEIIEWRHPTKRRFPHRSRVEVA
jgi:Histidine kinase-, DNA gyrase B-, and HSP90-like ATPase